MSPFLLEHLRDWLLCVRCLIKASVFLIFNYRSKFPSPNSKSRQVFTRIWVWNPITHKIILAELFLAISVNKRSSLAYYSRFFSLCWKSENNEVYSAFKWDLLASCFIFKYGVKNIREWCRCIILEIWLNGVNIHSRDASFGRERSHGMCSFEVYSA